MKDWRPEEIDILRQFAKSRSYKELAEMLPARSPEAIRRHMTKLGIEGRDLFFWSDDMDRYLAENLETKTNPELAAHLNKTAKAVQSRLVVLGLKRAVKMRERSSTEHPPGMLKAIIAASGRVPSSEVAKKYGLTKKAVHAIWHRARQRGDLPPQNYARTPAMTEEARPQRDNVVERVMADRGWKGTCGEPRRIAISLPRVRFLELGQ